ncbi:MAG: hypothetical protein ACK53Y_15855, partial [bacterium]
LSTNAEPNTASVLTPLSHHIKTLRKLFQLFRPQNSSNLKTLNSTICACKINYLQVQKNF